MPAKRRTIWLGLGLVVAIAALGLVRAMDAPPSPGAAAGRRTTPAARPAGRGAGQDALADSAPAVNLEQLAKTRGEPAESERNPFRFRPKPSPAAPAPEPTIAPPPGTVGSVIGPEAPSAPPGPPPPPPIALKFIGIVQKADGTRIAVLSDGKRPYYGTEGQDIEGQYRILKVGQESVEIAYIDGRGRQTLRLSGQ